MYVHICTHVSAYVCVCVPVYIYVHTHTHTHTHTCIHEQPYTCTKHRVWRLVTLLHRWNMPTNMHVLFTLIHVPCMHLDYRMRRLERPLMSAFVFIALSLSLSASLASATSQASPTELSVRVRGGVTMWGEGGRGGREGERVGARERFSKVSHKMDMITIYSKKHVRTHVDANL